MTASRRVCQTNGVVPLTVVAADFAHTVGMGLPNLALARRAARRGLATHLVAHSVARDLSDLHGVSWQRIPRPFGSDLLGGPLLSAAGLRAGATTARRGGRVIVNGGNCPFGDVNWVHYVHAAFRAPSHAGPLRDLKFRAEHPINLLTEKLALRRAQLLIANSRRTRRDLIQLLGIPAERIRVAPLGIDPQRFRPASEEQRERARRAFGFDQRPRIVFVGALSDRRKGFDTLFDAWTLLCARPSFDSDLVVVGQGAELPRWRERTRTAGLGERIRFLGFRDDVAEVLSACDALVAPVRYESFGRGVQEALCCGLPTIVSRDAGASECVPVELEGLLLNDPNSAAELAWRIDRWRGDAEAARREAIRASESLRKRTWDVMADEILSWLD